MGRIRVRTGMALATAGLATSGFALLSGAPAQAAQAETTVASAPSRDGLATCWFKVNARHGLWVRKGPGTGHGKITLLKKGTKIRTTCASSGWVKIHEPVKYKGKHIKGGWVARKYLCPLDSKAPHGAVDTGGGGTSTSEAASPLLPATGVGLFALGSGIAIAASRRRAAGAVPTT
jgi:hypothetical protein